MSDWFVGQKIVCVDDTQSEYAPHHLSKGTVYTIAGTLPGDDWFADPKVSGAALFLVETGRSGILGTPFPFGSHRFRPIQTDTIKVFRKIAEDVTNGKVLEIADV
jgi:hypothetical protein